MMLWPSHTAVLEVTKLLRVCCACRESKTQLAAADQHCSCLHLCASTMHRGEDLLTAEQVKATAAFLAKFLTFSQQQAVLIRMAWARS